MRYFWNYYDDTMRPTERHQTAELIGRKPLVVSFLGKPSRNAARNGVAGRMAKRFAKLLKQKGL